MPRHTFAPHEIILTTTTIDEGLKNVDIQYAISKQYTPNERLNIVKKMAYISAYSFGCSQWGVGLIGGYVEFHSDKELQNMPAKIEALDPEAITRLPREFYHYLGRELTEQLRFMLANNITDPTHAIFSPKAVKDLKQRRLSNDDQI